MFINEVIVAYGKPILKVSFRTIRYIAIFSSAYIFITIMYIFSLLIECITVKYHVGDFVDMVDTDGYVLPTGLAIPSLLGLLLCVLSLWFIYKTCRCDYVKRPGLNRLFFLFIIFIVACVCLIFIISIMLLAHSYSAHESLHDGITEAMSNYGLDSTFKRHMDMLQVEFQCCGSKKYSEWFNITWYDVNMVKER